MTFNDARPLCTHHELLDAFRQLVDESEARELAQEFFLRHNIRNAPATDTLYVASTDDHSDAAPLEGAVSVSHDAKSRPPFAEIVRALSRPQRAQVLLAFTPFTLDLLARHSDELFERVREFEHISHEEMRARLSDSFGI